MNEGYWWGAEVEQMKHFKNHLENAGICLDMPASHYLTPEYPSLATSREDDNYAQWWKRQDATRPFHTFIRSYVWNYPK